MTISVDLHNISYILARESGGPYTDILILSTADGSQVRAFMPLAVAQAMADAFNAVNVPKEREADAAIGGDLA